LLSVNIAASLRRYQPDQVPRVVPEVKGTLSNYDAPSVLSNQVENNNLFAGKSTDKLRILILMFDLSCPFRIGCAAEKVSF
jgi:hypothetical protein